MSANVREWIISQLTNLLPSDSSEIRSDTNEILFQQWTGATQASLEATWIGEDTQRVINNMVSGAGEDTSTLRFRKGVPQAIANAKAIIAARRDKVNEMVQAGMMVPQQESLYKSVGTTTTCNVFLGTVVRKALAAGGLEPRHFPSFDLPNANVNAWNWYPTPGKSPKPGDFFQAGTRNGMYKHVGIILEINGELMTTADSGQGGPSVGYDIIKRKKRSLSEIMGWIDVDVFFKNWKGAQAQAAAQ
jgi:hypothetical protein